MSLLLWSGFWYKVSATIWNESHESYEDSCICQSSFDVLLRFSDFRSFRAVFLFCAVAGALFTLLYFGTLHTLVRDSCALYTT